MRTMLGDESPRQWRRINRELHRASGDVHELADEDRVTVQRLDRTIQSYERLNDRTHKVYVAVELPDTHRNVRTLEDLPSSFHPGSLVAFDQFTMGKHNIHETPGHDSNRHVVFEIVTSRGMYLGRSDSVEDTTHILPRGMIFESTAASHAPYETADGGFDERIIVQLKEW
ncbi:hypothetical protein [Mycolicibacterium peregrinum]|uniref:hypothetical protein n=1 Tax=Mycolicibacterium peregrinum TaxID=43304 RepID=UPI003AAB7F91